MVENGITLGQWFRNYSHVDFEPTAEDVAFACCDLLKWPATPALIGYMVKMVEEEGLLGSKED